MKTTKFIIKGVSESNKFKGSYAKIFKILERGLIFTEIFESDTSVGWKDGNYYLEIDHVPEGHELEEILKIKNINLHN